MVDVSVALLLFLAGGQFQLEHSSDSFGIRSADEFFRLLAEPDAAVLNLVRPNDLLPLVLSK